MSTSRIEELRLDVEELNRLEGTTQRQKVKDILSLEIRKLETEISNALSSLKKIEETGASKPVKSTSARCYDVKLNNYAWDQSDKFVKIFVTLKNLQTLEQENVSCNFSRRSMELQVKGLEGKNYNLPINNLLEDIDEEKSYWKVKTDNVVVYLLKKSPGKWSYVTSVEKKAHEMKSPKFEAGDDPSKGLMNVLKQMYDEGDDDMKRTIAKAWTESRDKQTSEDFGL